ncbi:MAG TPA: hypothetical protein VMA36_09965 [Candidatus Limnocylindria bacterium]|jgi:hypothetical protein|nr:hypothetical protein [Candidatus Limnocylindria bacterium]
MLAAILLALGAVTFQPVTPATTSQPSDVFVRDASAQAQPGPGGHVWGIRPPTGGDPDTVPLLNANGDPLKAVLGIWRTADGNLQVTPGPKGERVRAVFHHLIADGRYSLFLRQLAGGTGAVFTPLDVTGMANSFSADDQGNAEAVVSSPLALPPGTQVVLIYHSDGTDHASSLGNPGINAHTQLIARLP